MVRKNENFIKKFDEKIKELIELNPNDDCLKVIIEFKDKKKYDSFYMALDDIGSIIGRIYDEATIKQELQLDRIHSEH